MESSPSSSRAWIPLLAGLIAAASTGLLFFPVEPGRRLPWVLILIAALAYYLATVLATSAAVTIAQVVLPRHRLTTPQLISRALSRAAWIAPLMVFLKENSLWAAPLAIFVAVRVLRLFRRPRAAAPPEVQGLFGLVPPRPVSDAILFLGLAACLETALLAVGAERNALAAGLFALAAAFFASRTTILATQRTSGWRLAGTMLLGFLLTIASLSRHLEITPRDATGAFPPDLLAQLFGAEGGPENEDSRKRPNRTGTAVADFNSEAYPGVILWPEVQRHVTIVPPLPAMRRDIFADRKTEHPLSIPFFGVYWFLRPGYREPPNNAFVTYGVPSIKRFRNNDLLPMKMEAHQNLGRSIDLSCCSSIQIGITNADRQPSTVSIELTVGDTAAKGRPPMSLGNQPVTSTPALATNDAGGSVHETLTYRVPPDPLLRSFDDLSVEFHLDRSRTSVSAKISIDEFVLVPRR